MKPLTHSFTLHVLFAPLILGLASCVIQSDADISMPFNKGYGYVVYDPGTTTPAGSVAASTNMASQAVGMMDD